MTKQEYLGLPGLSNSGMKDLIVSPLRYWHHHINPDRLPRPETPEQKIGSALHCAVLEPSAFDDRYARTPSCDDWPDCLRTDDDLKVWLKANDIKPTGKLKADHIAQVIGSGLGHPPILDVELAQSAERNAGKSMLTAEEWIRVAGMAQTLREEPRINKLLDRGQPEQIFRIDFDGVPLKGCLDWIDDRLILDLKTFSQKRGDDIDRTIAQAIWYEGYYRQMAFYAQLRGWPEWRGDVVIAFVESDPPHETRFRSFHPKTGTQANVYWTRANIEIRKMVHTYGEYSKHFGLKPWRYAQDIVPLMDEEIPQLAY